MNKLNINNIKPRFKLILIKNKTFILIELKNINKT